MVDGRSIVEYSLEEVKALKAMLDAAGIRVSAVGSPIGKVQITDDFDRELARFRHTLDIAGALDTPYIRMFSFYIPKESTRAEYRGEVLRRLRVFVAEAEVRGVILLHENEGGIYGEGADECADLFASIPSPSFRAVFDPANFVVAGVEVYPYAYELLKDHIHYLHIKDAVRHDENSRIRVAGEGEGRVADVLKALKEAGYSGFLSLEPHLHSVYRQKDVFAAYKAARERGESGVEYVGDGLAHFTRARDALVNLLKEINA
jgi:sugar phosphate isomerase/epimerase